MDIKKLPNFINNILDRGKPKLLFNPLRDWKLMLGIIAAMIFLVSLLSYYIYFKFVGSEVDLSSEDKVMTISREKLKGVIGLYTDKKQRHKNLLETPLKIIDPSE